MTSTEASDIAEEGYTVLLWTISCEVTVATPTQLAREKHPYQVHHVLTRGPATVQCSAALSSTCPEGRVSELSELVASVANSTIGALGQGSRRLKR